MNNKQKKALKAKFSDGLSSSGMMVSTLSEWYDAKHRSPSADEVAFVNSIPVGTCPRCGSENVRKDGRSKKTGLIVRECKDCGKKFGPLTGTVFDSRKIPFIRVKIIFTILDEITFTNFPDLILLSFTVFFFIYMNP